MLTNAGIKEDIFEYERFAFRDVTWLEVKASGAMN